MNYNCIKNNIFIRITAIVLSILISNCIYIFAEANITNTTVETSPKYNNALSTLNSLGIITPKDSEGKVVSDTVTKEFGAYIISKLINSVNTDQNLFYFNDVGSDNQYRLNINTLVQVGAVSVNDEKMFNPKDNLTYTQVGKMLVCIFGYQQLAEVNGGYPIGYFNVMNSLKLFSDLNVTDMNAAITFSDMVLLINKSLTCEVLQVTGVKNNEIVLQNKDKTILENVFNLKRGSGIVSATKYQKINNSLVLKDDEVEIDSIIYKFGSTNVEDFFGYKVEFFFKEDNDNAQKEIVSLNLNKFKNDRIQIMPDDIIEASKDKITYNENNNKTTISFSSDSIFVYNGRYLPNIDAESLIPQNGIVTAISNNSSADFNIISITDYDDYVVGGVDVTNKVISVMSRQYDSSKALLNDKIDVDSKKSGYDVCFIRDGKEISLNDIKAGQIISVSESKDDANKQITIWASYRTVSGAVTEATDDEVIIEGKKYKVDAKYKDPLVYELNKVKTFYLDEGLKIAYYNLKSASEEKYGYLINVSSSSSLSEISEFKILSVDDGKVQIYKNAEDISLNNQKRVNGKKYTGKMIANLIFTEPNYGDLIKYSLDKDGKISNITVAKNTTNIPLTQQDENEFRLNYDGNVQFGARLANQYRIDNKLTKYIFIPPALSSDDDDYYIGSFSTSATTAMPSITGISIPRNQYFARLYNVGRDMMCKFVVVKGVSKTESSNVPATNSVMVVKNVTSIVDKDGNSAYKLNGYVDGVETSAIFASNVYKVPFCIRNDSYELPDGSVVTKSTKVYWYIDNGWENDHTVPLKNYLETGDMIQFIKNRDGEISYLRLVMDIRRTTGIENGIVKTWNDWNSTTTRITYGYQYDSALYVAYAKVIDIANGSIIINPNASEGFPVEWNQSLGLAKANYYYYDSTSKTVKKGSISDIIKGSYVAVRAQSIASKIDILIIR